MTPIGMIVALQWARRLRKLLESLGWFGTVCSSWIFLCRGTSKRTVYRPLGDTNILFVREGNRMTARSALLIAYLYSTGVTWCLEQPASSLMICFEPMKLVMTVAQQLGLPCLEATLCMGAYDAETEKPSKLYSNSPFVHRLVRDMTTEQRAAVNSDGVAKFSVNAHGQRVVSGGPKLKQTQTYTKAFGEAVVLQHFGKSPVPIADLVVDEVFGERAGFHNDSWADLALDEVHLASHHALLVNASHMLLLYFFRCSASARVMFCVLCAFGNENITSS